MSTWPCRDRVMAHRYAGHRAERVGFNPKRASALAERLMIIWDPEFTQREWDAFIDEEIRVQRALKRTEVQP